MPTPLRRRLCLAVAALALAGTSCRIDHVWVYVLGDSHSDPDRDPRHDWLPWTPGNWRFNDLSTSSAKCWEIVPEAFTRPLLNRGDVMVIFCGTNDAARSDWDLEVTRAWIEAAIDDATRHGRDAVAVTPPPAFREYPVTAAVRNARLAALRDEIHDLADQYGARVADLWAETWAHPDPESLFVDGLHFGEAGRILMAQVIQAAVENEP